jgi:TonB-dependent SusC/RagA subfamily outer membrane receptor
MSLSPHRVSFVHVADVLISAALLVSAGACYHAPSEAPQPAVEPSGQRQQSTDGGPRRFSGVDIVPTGHSAFVIRIHSGMVGDGEPLYVIDGNPMMIPPNRGIDWFKPEDIAEIKVLKYPDELAVYGPRGVNGVIVITTKQGAGLSRER